MPTKSHRPGLSKHSRSSSASKIASGHSSSRLAQTAGLQFTSTTTNPRTKEEKLRKLEGHPRPSSPFARPNSRGSFHRTKSRETIQPVGQAAPRAPASKRKPGKAFTLASNSSEDEDDQWVSESVTPNEHLDSDMAPDLTPADKLIDAVDLQRVETARANTFQHEQTPVVKASIAAPSLDKLPQRVPSLPRIQTSQPTPPPISNTRHQSQTQPPTPNSSKRDPSRRHSHRPPSVHSLASVPARPHPLIRGASFAEPSKAQTSAEASSSDNAEPVIGRSTSPTASLRSLSRYSPTSRRRTSVSSTNTVPGPNSPNPASSALHATQQHDARERQRTLSTLSTASSNHVTGISSLFHIPSFSTSSVPASAVNQIIGR
ncbi:hypothetical protein DL96DRAFT_1145673 [Flagelloscypha sp. PMI_526]|nr:hypothetical protein DL96DRAFT_1145673 [Flagelloscypha sp. PMI_526]